MPKSPFIVPTSVQFLVHEWEQNMFNPEHIGITFKTKLETAKSFKIWSETCNVHKVTDHMIVLEIEEMW